MKTTTTMNDAVLSLDDVRAESALLRPHDLTSLHTRLEGAIRRRQLATALLAGAAALIAAGGLAHLASRDWTPAPPPPPPPVIEQPLMAATSTAPVLHLETAPAQPCTIVEAPPAPAPRPIIVVQRAVESETKVERIEQGEDDERIVVEGSRLRSQLRIYDEGQRALVGGDPERALARSTHLREKYPNGPLDIDAAILGVRALRALERLDEARSALDDAEKHPMAPEKRTVLAELRMLLTKTEPPEPPRRIFESVHDEREPRTREQRDDAALLEERHPSRVITPVTQ